MHRGILAVFLMLAALSLHAMQTLDARNLLQPLQLFGPWSYASRIVPLQTLEQSDAKTLRLPCFVEPLFGTSQTEATFALRLKTVPGIPLTLDLKEPLSVWKLYINDCFVASSGRFGTDSKAHKAAIYGKNITFTPHTEVTTLLIQLGNSQHQHIGFYKVPVVAPTHIIEKTKSRIYLLEMLMIVILILVGIYHIGLFGVWKKDKAPLWFGVLCLFVALRVSSTGETVLIDLFDSISWETLLRIQYISGCIALPLYVWYLDALYPNQIIKTAKYFYLFIAFFFLILASFFPVYIFTPFLFPYEFVYLSFIIYSLVVLWRAFSVGEIGSFLALAAFWILSGFLLYDFLRFDNVIVGPTDIAPYGFILYLIAQVTLLLQRYAQAYSLVEGHSEYLEQTVLQRTLELKTLAEQKELLLRELTHRVKNNLQFIVNLLQIQRKDADEKTLAALKTVESQIQSVSSVHEILCTQKNVASIELNGYLEKLTDSLRSFYPTIAITVENLFYFHLKPDYAVSLGLIINELVANHLKHSDLQTIQPVQIVILGKTESQVVLRYTDGFDHRESYGAADSSIFGLPKLGWPMIKVLVRQIDAEIHLFGDYIELHLSGESIQPSDME